MADASKGIPQSDRRPAVPGPAIGSYRHCASGFRIDVFPASYVCGKPGQSGRLDANLLKNIDFS